MSKWEKKANAHTKIEIETETEETIQFETNYFNCNRLPVEFQAVFLPGMPVRLQVENLINFVENINFVINDVRYVKRPI